MTCSQPGETTDWDPVHKMIRKPKCNRPDGHDGPHREYSKTAQIKAEWND